MEARGSYRHVAQNKSHTLHVAQPCEEILVFYLLVVFSRRISLLHQGP